MNKEDILVKIYCLVDPITLKVRYIGRTYRPLKRRLIQHISRARYSKVYYPEKKDSHKDNWLNKLYSLGQKPIIRLLTTIKGWSESHKFERKLIHKYKDRLVNFDDRGEGTINLPRTEEVKEKIRKTCLELYKSGRKTPPRSKIVHIYDKKGYYIDTCNSILEASKKYDVDKNCIAAILRKEVKFFKRYLFSYEKIDKISVNLNILDIYKIKVFSYIDNNWYEFESIQECSNNIKATNYRIYHSLDTYNLVNGYLLFTSKIDISFVKNKYQTKKYILNNINTGESMEFGKLDDITEFLNIKKKNTSINKVSDIIERRKIPYVIKSVVYNSLINNNLNN